MRRQYGGCGQSRRTVAMGSCRYIRKVTAPCNGTWVEICCGWHQFFLFLLLDWGMSCCGVAADECDNATTLDVSGSATMTSQGDGSDVITCKRRCRSSSLDCLSLIVDSLATSVSGDQSNSFNSTTTTTNTPLNDSTTDWQLAWAVAGADPEGSSGVQTPFFTGLIFFIPHWCIWGSLFVSVLVHSSSAKQNVCEKLLINCNAHLSAFNAWLLKLRQFCVS